MVTTNTEIVWDECWNCARTLEEDTLYVEFRLMRSVLDSEGNRSSREETPVGDPYEVCSNVYYRICLDCALSSPISEGSCGEVLPGINFDNLDACCPDWRDSKGMVNLNGRYDRRDA